MWALAKLKFKKSTMLNLIVGDKQACLCFVVL